MEGFVLISFAILCFFVLSIFLGSFFTVQTAQVAIVQRLGKFARTAGPGLNWKTPFLETVVQRMSMKVHNSKFRSKRKPRTTYSYRSQSPFNTK
jgi:regulator of protease activity HflC (stomatin/prohibitin superfamily)